MTIIPNAPITDNPVFWKTEIDVTMDILDNAGVPKTEGDATLTMSERVAFLVGMYRASQSAPRVFVVGGAK